MPLVRICAGGTGQPVSLPRPVKRALDGTYHALKQRRYARCYLGEAQYRFNRRFRLSEVLPRLTRAVVLCMPCPEPLLRATTSYLY